jgi:ABC-type Co2+ transport system permease subunit
MHALSLPTWWIHITSVLEWMVAMVAVQQLGRRRAEPAWNWLALAMLPALVSAMCACTWHLYDNSPSLYGLVVLQAGLTALGNLALALACLLLVRRQGSTPQPDEGRGDG